MVFRNNKRAAQGIGTLIIFIALILVAAVAAGVLIQTASTLQSKALDVGRQSQEKITTNIEVVQVYARGAQDGWINGTTDNITVVIRLGSGSNPVKLQDMLIKFDVPSGSQTVRYITDNNMTETTYSVDFIINGTNHQPHYLVEGDMAALSFFVKTGTAIGENSAAILRVLARNGAIKPVDMTTPPAMVEETLYLFP